MAHSAYRWFSSVLLHSSFVHIGSTALLFAVVSAQLEQRFGTKRILLLSVLAAVGGNFFGAAFQVGHLAVKSVLYACTCTFVCV